MALHNLLLTVFSVYYIILSVMYESLKELKDKRYIGVAELGAQAAEILEGIPTYQEKGTVTEYPDERTIRFYISESLIPPATEKQGTASVFGYEHLLTLLVIKKLQSQNLPIKKIREILRGKNLDELENLLGVSDAAANEKKNDAQRYLESLLLQKNERADKVFASSPRPPSVKPPAPAASPGTGQTWERFEIEDGLELHVKKNFRPPSGFNERRALIKVMEEIIRSLGQK